MLSFPNKFEGSQGCFRSQTSFEGSQGCFRSQTSFEGSQGCFRSQTSFEGSHLIKGKCCLCCYALNFHKCTHKTTLCRESDRMPWCRTASYGKIRIRRILRAFPGNFEKLSKKFGLTYTKYLHHEDEVA